MQQDTAPVEFRAPLETKQFASVSSNVHSALYDFGATDLYLRFKRDGVDAIYFYSAVPASTWQGLVDASSKGRYVNDSIAYSYRYERISISDWPQQGRGVASPVARRFLTAPMTADPDADHPHA